MVKNENHAWSILAKLIPEKSEVLDIGCSSGNFGAELIAKKNCVVDGIEPDQTDSKLAAKRLRTVWTLNIETDSLAAIRRKYDVIVMADVIEHLVFPAAALRRLKSLLKPSGRLVFSVPNMAHISVRLALLAGNFTYTETGLLDKTHLHYYDHDELQHVLDEAGLAVRQIDYTQIQYPQPLIDKKLKALGLTASKQFYDRLSAPAYHAYQFIGEAEYVSGKPVHKPITAKQAVQNDFIQMSQEVQYTTNRLLATQKELQRTQQELEAVKNSKAYRLARRASTLIHPTKPI